MFKRIVLSALLIGFIGLLVWGGVVRTIAKNDQVLGVAAEERYAEGRGQGGEGLGREQGEHGSSEPVVAEKGASAEHDCDDCEDSDDCGSQERSADQARGQGQGEGAGDGQGAGQGQGQGAGDGSGQGEGQGQNSQFVEKPEGWDTVTGTVVVAPGEDIDLVIETASGELEIGTGPNWMASQGYLLEVGEEVTIVGYEQDGEFKAGTITRVSDGESITLRDETGRPAWSGQGNRKNQ